MFYNAVRQHTNRWDVLGTQDTDQLLCTVLIPKGNMTIQIRPKHAIMQEVRNHLILCCPTVKKARKKKYSKVFVQLSWWNAQVEKV